MDPPARAPAHFAQHHFFDLLDLFEQIVREAPIPASFEHRLARPLELLEELNEAVH